MDFMLTDEQRSIAEVTRSFVDEADLVFRIDYGRPDAPALGAAVSAALIGFEVLRQRRGRES